jgi:hypothetical protein
MRARSRTKTPSNGFTRGKVSRAKPARQFRRTAILRPVDHPRLESLQDAVARLTGAGIPCALGGSGLLAALGLVDHVRDWDVTAEGDLAAIAALFADRPHEIAGNAGIHADHKVMLTDDDLEVIVNFAFNVEGPVFRIPTIVSGSWQGMPLASPEAWAVAYALMGEYEGVAKRRERAEMLFAHVERTGADPEAIRLLLAEPLPEFLVRRLIALSTTSPASPDGSDAGSDAPPG